MDKKKFHKGKVTPSMNETIEGMDNKAFEMEKWSLFDNRHKEILRDVANKAGIVSTHARTNDVISKWIRYIKTKRKWKQNMYRKIPVNGFEKQNDRREDKAGEKAVETEGKGLSHIDPEYLTKIADKPKFGLERQISSDLSRMLLQYFADRGKHDSEADYINMDTVESLVTRGADINCTDKYGQTILHEISRLWHVDVGKFIIKLKANVDQPDRYGRTPLHVAAATDHSEMVELLLDHGADIEAVSNEEQTPAHYAAKSDACKSLQVLIDRGARYKDVVDYKGRTPIHIAAELDRSETASLLLDHDAPIHINDKYGHKTITWMITKMPPVAFEALDQFHQTDRAQRKQTYDLNYLVQEKDANGKYMLHLPTPLHVAVQTKQFSLLMNKTMQELLSVMWNKFGSFGAWVNLFTNFFYIMIWTVIGIVIEYDKRHTYTFPDHWWRVVLWVVAIVFTVWQIGAEINEFYRSRRSYQKWKEMRKKELEEDIKRCHEQWPAEKKFLNDEIKSLSDAGEKYFSDPWNIFDWICYIMLITSCITHFVDVALHSETLARVHIRIMTVNIILLWLRLMKNARAFSQLGPFIVMLTHMIGDLLKFTYLYLEFFIPYACAFWMTFGGDKLKEGEDPSQPGSIIKVPGMEDPNKVIFTLFRMTLVDDYPYDDMKQVDSIMTDVLVGTWLAFSAVLCLNLLIALLSDTFQRVYDNAQANSMMQKAMTILNIWEGMSPKRKLKFLEFIENKCSPLRKDYDDDVVGQGEEDLKKVTIQIKEKMDEFEDIWRGKGLIGDDSDDDDEERKEEDIVAKGNKFLTIKKFDNEISVLQDSIKNVQDRQQDMADRYKEDMSVIMSLLTEIAGHKGSSQRDIEVYQSVPPQYSDVTDTRPLRKRRKKKKPVIDTDVVTAAEADMIQESLGGGMLLDTVEISQSDVSRLTQQLQPVQPSRTLSGVQHEPDIMDLPEHGSEC